MKRRGAGYDPAERMVHSIIDPSNLTQIILAEGSKRE